jgi:hypothetical protein
MASQPSTSPAPPTPPTASATPPRKAGTSPWVWVAVGCGGLLVIVLLALLAGGYLLARKARDIVGDAGANPAVAAVKLAIAVNPDLEIVKSDEKDGVITIRDRRTGEVLTVDMAEVDRGHVVFRNGKGEEISIGGMPKRGRPASEPGTGAESPHAGRGGGEKIPGWVPAYPGAEAAGSMTKTVPEGVEGGFSFGTGDGPAEVLAYFSAKLEGAGFAVSHRTQQHDGRTVGGVLTATSAGGSRSLSVMAAAVGDSTHVVVTYQEKR